jgi:hypothetical protein
VGHDVASDGLLRVGWSSRRVVDGRDDLVRHYHCDTKLHVHSSVPFIEVGKVTYLIGETEETPQELGEMHLPRTQFTPPAEIRSIQRRDGIDNEE